MEWKEVTLGEVSSKIGDGLHGTPKYNDEGSYYFINGNNLNCGQIIIKNDTKRVGIDEFVKNQKDLNEQTILVSINGTIGNVAKYNNEPCILGKSACYINVIKEVDKEFIYYVLTSANFKRNITNEATGTTIKNVSLKQMREYKFNIPCNLADQRRIASILASLDQKIELNNKINADLEEMAQAIFKNWFVDFEPFKDGKFVDSELGMIPEGWKVGRADDFYQINIGKTPPRKEHQWFSTNPADKIWVSIANMGNSGIFISDSSEYLTKEAVDRHNIIMVPKNTILLSFKLTVGRVAIADKELTTNEAIARFILSDDKYMEYLYLYLKKYDYNSLGSTSSIATAVNSKTIKGMQMLQPSDNVIDAFHIQVNPIFEKIRSLTKENSRLSLLRDTLLPRLMSGELEIPE